MPNSTGGTSHLKMLREMGGLLEVVDRRLAVLRNDSEADASEIAHLQLLRARTANGLQMLALEPLDV